MWPAGDDRAARIATIRNNARQVGVASLIQIVGDIHTPAMPVNEIRGSDVLPGREVLSIRCPHREASVPDIRLESLVEAGALAAAHESVKSRM